MAERAGSKRDRLDDMERRLRAVEALLAQRSPAAGAPCAGPGAPGPEAGGDFWALAGLRDRAGDQGAVLLAGTLTAGDGASYEWQQGVLAEELLGGLGEEDTLAQVTDGLAALAHPVRLRLLLAVLDGRQTSAELGSIEGSGTSGQLYHHLRQLTAAGWLRSAGRGRYQVPAERVIPLLASLAAARR